MTEQALNQLAWQVLLDTARLEYGILLEETPEHTFSPAFERKMKKMLRRGKHPVWYKTLHAAACLLLALILSGCAVLVVSPEVREVFAGWVRETYETHFVYRFFGEDEEPLSEADIFYRPAYVPDGYQTIHTKVLDGLSSIVYQNDLGKLVVFTYFGDISSATLQVAREDVAVYKKVLVNGISADLYLDQDAGEANVLVWVDASKGAAFRISAILGEAELVKMAESVEAVKRNVIYRPSWLPDGYYETYADDSDGRGVLTYENGKSGLLTVSYGYDMLALSGEEEGADVFSVFVGENPADLYLDRMEGNASSLVWVDGNSGVFFWVSGPFDGEELIQIAESLEAYEEPPSL